MASKKRSIKGTANRRKKDRADRPYEVYKKILMPVTPPLRGLSFNERLQHFRETASAAGEIFNREFPSLGGWFEEFDAVYLLAFYAVYYLTEPEGMDREARDGRLDFYPHYLEILQAIALTRPRSESRKPLLEQATILPTLMSTITGSFHERLMDPPEEITPLDYKKKFVLASLQSQSAAIRNPAYPHQIREHASRIFSRLSPKFVEHFGVEPLKVLAALEKILDQIELRLNVFRWKRSKFLVQKTFESVWKVYLEEFPWVDQGEAGLHRIQKLSEGDLKEFKTVLSFYLDQFFLPTVMTFDLPEFAESYGDSTRTFELRQILEAWSYDFGSLKDENPEHFMITNPVHRRPMVRLGGDRYFFPLAIILGHLTPMMMETLVGLQGTAAKEKYTKVRADILEERTFEILSKRFPKAHIFRGSRWTDPVDGKTYENDLLVKIDSFVIVIECKAGAIDLPARRGGEARVITTLKELVVDGAEQAARFIRFLSENRGEHEFDNGRRGINTVNSSEIREFIPLSITHEDLGMIGANLRMCVDAGLIKSDFDLRIPSMSVHDLDVACQILESEIEVLHYLRRRAEFELQVDYIADEGDLLAFYLDTGFNLGDEEKAGRIALNLLLKSKELDPYFTAKERGITVDKPRLRLTKWWRDLIDYISERKVQGWTEIGCALLNVQFEEQKDFERNFEKLSHRVREGLVEQKYNWVTLITAPADRSYVIAGFPFVTRDRDERNEMIDHIMREAGEGRDVMGIVCIATFVRERHYPYTALAYTDGVLADESSSPM